MAPGWPMRAIFQYLGFISRREAPGKRASRGHHPMEGCGRGARAGATLPLVQPGESSTLAGDPSHSVEGQQLRTVSQPVNP